MWALYPFDDDICTKEQQPSQCSKTNLAMQLSQPEEEQCGKL